MTNFLIPIGLRVVYKKLPEHYKGVVIGHQIDRHSGVDCRSLLVKWDCMARPMAYIHPDGLIGLEPKKSPHGAHS